MIRMGFIGPASGDVEVFEEKVAWLLGEAGCSRVHYLGDCDVLDAAARARSRELGLDSDVGFDGAALALARAGDAEAIERFLHAREALVRLEACRALPRPPARTIEMMEDRILLMVFDKAVLDEEDIANADVVIYGRAAAPLVRKIGPRIFFSPGPAGLGHGVATLDESGLLTFSAYDAEDQVVAGESLAPRSARFSVSS
jgi:hypothetical protein